MYSNYSRGRGVFARFFLKNRLTLRDIQLNNSDHLFFGKIMGQIQLGAYKGVDVNIAL